MRLSCGLRDCKLNALLMRRFLLLAALAPMCARADVAIWNSSDVRVTLGRDGALSVVEQATVFVPEGVSDIERYYWSDADERVKVIRVVRIEANGTEVPESFEWPGGGMIRWKTSASSAPQRTYRIETRVTGVVVPIWSVDFPVRQRDTFTSPLARLKKLIATWRDLGSNPASRYVLDYQFLFPDQQQEISLQPSLAFGPEWKPVHLIPAGDIGSVVKAEPFGVPESFHIHHIFDYIGVGGPDAVNLRTPVIRDLSVFAFPLIAALLWLVYLRHFVFSRPD